LKIIFHIGFHKTGTTWLQRNVFSNLNLVVNSEKPWDDAFLRYLILSDEASFEVTACKQLLKDRLKESSVNIVSAERLTGHPYSGHIDRYRIMNRIKLCFPEAQVICGVRKPASIIESIYKQMVKEGYPGKIESLFYDQWKGFSFDLNAYDYLKFYNYSLNLFGKENIFFFAYERFKLDNESLLLNLSQFLETDLLKSSNKSMGVENKAFKNSYYRVRRILNYFTFGELNKTPIVVLPKSLQNLIIKFFRPFFSNKPFNLTKYSNVHELDKHYDKLLSRIK